MKRITLSSRELTTKKPNLLITAGLAISADKIELTQLEDTRQATLANKALTIASPLVSEATCIKEIHISPDAAIVKVEGKFNSEVAKAVQWMIDIMKEQSLSSVFFPALSTESEATIYVGQKGTNIFASLPKNVVDAKLLGQDLYFCTDKNQQDLLKVSINSVLTEKSWQKQSQIVKSFSSDIQGFGRFSVKTNILPITLSKNVFQKYNIETGSLQNVAAQIDTNRTYLGQFRLSDTIDHAAELFLGTDSLTFGQLTPTTI